MNKPLKHLDLFSGIGGFALGLKWAGGFETVGFCEIDPYCQKVLHKNFPEVPIYDDIRTLEHDGSVDIITGGYPCQPFSMAGKRKGAEDDRHLWPAMFDLIKKHRPTWVIGENVAGHINMGLDDVLADLESEGYGTRTFIIPACAVDAKHRRDRVWIVAHTGEQSLSISNATGDRDNRASQGSSKKARRSHRKQAEQFTIYSEIQSMADPSSKGLQDGRRSQDRRSEKKSKSKRCRGKDGRIQPFPNPDSLNAQGQQSSDTDPQEWPEQGQRQVGSQDASVGRVWTTKSGVGGNSNGVSRELDQFRDDGIPRVASKIPKRVDRLKGLGNAIVPQIAEILGRAITNSMKEAA